MDHYGIRGITLDLCKSYISDRYQCIEFYGVLSHLKNINGGVPQGSVLRPILFILYINDYPVNRPINSKTVNAYQLIQYGINRVPSDSN